MSGLNNSEQKEWKISTSEAAKPIMERLKPGTELHMKTLTYLMARLNHSEKKMKIFHPRWRLAEMRHQAYINLPDYEKILKTATETGAPPEITSIVVPYSFATVNTIVTYLVNVFTGRKPMFTLGTYKKDSVDAVKYQEILLQQNADHTRLVKHIYQFLNDGQIYGVGVLRNIWVEEKHKRTVVSQSTMLGMAPQTVRSREMKTVYSGNECASVDPFMFFPDPSVPMNEVNKKGEYVFWRTFSGKHQLLTLQAQKRLANVEVAGALPADSYGDAMRNSNFNTNTSSMASNSDTVISAIQEDTCTIRIIPAELGLGESQVPETWLFTILNKKVIAQAMPLDYDHDRHPVIVHEPYSAGYGFGHNGMSDMLAPIQDALSWLMNSHIYNVRAALNNSFVVDPARVEIQDLKSNKPGKIIRVKPSAMGQDVRSMITQLQVTDVTGSHLGDMQMFMRIGDALSAVNDNTRGMTSSSSRTTATEVRTSAESGSSRLASLARFISAQAMVDLGEQMSVNIMQFQTDEFSINVIGEDGIAAMRSISPEQLVGDFYYPVHDGTLPIDKVAILDVWKDIFMGVAKDQELRQTFDLVKIFEHTAEVGGAKDIQKFVKQQPAAAAQPPLPNITAQPNEQIASQAQAGNIVPIQQLLSDLKGRSQ